LAAADVGQTIRVQVTAANCTGTVTSSNTSTVAKATQAAPAAPTLASNTSTSITLNAIENGEYNLNSGSWQTSPTFTGLEPSMNYMFRQRRAETATHFASPESVGVNFATNSPEHVPVTNIIDVPTNATATIPLTLTGTVVPSNASNQTIVWSVVNPETGATITGGNILNTVNTATVGIRATIINGLTPTTPYIKDFNITVTKATQEKPDAPTMASNTATSITLNIVSGCEYSINGGAYQSSPVFSGLTPNTPYNFTQRMAETNTHLPSLSSSEAIFSTKEATGNIYTIVSSVNNTAWGTITPYGEAKVEEGSDITFTITPNTNYEIEKVLVNGTSVGAVDTYTFENVQADGAIEVIFKQKVGIETITNDELRITVYPNPTTGQLTIDNGQLTIDIVEIYDVYGKKLFTNHYSLFTNDGVVLDISYLPKGIYLLQIKTDKGLVNKKVIKN